MSSTIFLTPVPAAKKTVWLEIKNTSDQEFDLSALASALTARGYRIVDDPDQANYRLQINVLYIGKSSISAIRDSMYAGWGGALGGAAAGGLAGAASSPRGAGIGAGIGGLVGGAAELVSGALVKKVTFGVVTDVQLSEKSDAQVAQTQTAAIQQGTATTVQQQVGEVSGWRLYRTRVASTATKVNLELQEARPALTERLVRSLAGIL
jgi:hypothetical protein